jgi:hypothetical protein
MYVSWDFEPGERGARGTRGGDGDTGVSSAGLGSESWWEMESVFMCSLGTKQTTRQ